LEVAGEALGRLAHQHPLIMIQANGNDGTYKISDFLSRQTVRKHLEHIYRRLGVHTREAAVSMAREAPGISP